MSEPPRSRLTYVAAGDPFLKRLLINAVEVVSGRRHLERLYNEVSALDLEPAALWEAVLEKLEVSVDFDAGRLESVPSEGPVVFIANHPFGVVDGLILGYLVSRVRSRFCVLVNHVLCREDKLSEYLLPIDFSETRQALATNIESRRRTLERLRAGEALAIFPAGGVSTAVGPWGPLQDLSWKRFVVKVIRQTQATVVPVFVHGRNSPLFQLASQFSQNLRLSLLLHEVRNKMGTRVRLSIGDSIPYAELAAMRDAQVMLDHLHGVTWGMADGGAVAPSPRPLPRYLRS